MEDTHGEGQEGEMTPSDPEMFKKIREAGEKAIRLAQAEKEKNAPLNTDGVNWANLGVIGVRKCRSEDGRIHWWLEIEEASPNAGVFASFIAEKVEKMVGFLVYVDIDW